MKALYYALLTAFASFAVAYLKSARALSDGQASLLIMLNTIGAFAGQFILGRMCDYFHTHRKIFLLACLLTAPIALGVFFCPALAAIYPLYFAFGFCQTPLFVITDTWFLASFPDDASLYGKVLASGACAYAVFSFSYGKLLDAVGYGIMPWCLLGVLAAIVLLALTTPDASSSYGRAQAAQGRARFPAPLIGFMAILLGMGVCTNSYNLLPVLMEHVNGSLGLLGLALSASGTAQIPFMLISGRMKRFSPRLRMLLSGAMFLAMALSFAFGSSPWHLIAGACLSGAAWGILLPAYREIISALAPAELSTTAQSLADAVYLSLGSVLSSGFVSAASGAFGLRGPLLCLAAVLVTSLLALVIVNPGAKQA